MLADGRRQRGEQVQERGSMELCFVLGALKQWREEDGCATGSV